MNTKETIELLTALALRSYREKIHPDLFAVNAAHILAKDAAAKFSPDSADAAAFLASFSLFDLSGNAAQQAAYTTQMHYAMKNYHTEKDETVTAAFVDLATRIKKISLRSEAIAVYDSIYDCDTIEKNKLARYAASEIYTHAYASSRIAYTHAIAAAAKYSTIDEHQAAFKCAMSSRLSANLLHESIEPSFFIQIMCSDAMKFFGALLLVAGLAALTIGICGFAMAPFGAMLIAAVGVNSASILTTGIVTTTVSAGLFAGCFFSAKQRKSDNDRSAEAVREINNSEPCC